MQKHQHNFLWSPSDPASRALVVDWMKARGVYHDEGFWPTFINFVNKTVDTLHHQGAAPPEYEPADFAVIMQSSLPAEDLLELMGWFLRGVYSHGRGHPQFIINGLVKAHEYGDTEAINDAQTRLQGKILHLKAKWAVALLRSYQSGASEGNARARRNAARRARSTQSATQATQQPQVATLPEFSVADLLETLPAASSPPAEGAEEEGGVILKQHSEMTYRPKP